MAQGTAMNRDSEIRELQRQVAMLRRLILTIVVGACTAVLLGQAGPRVLVADSLILTDPEGRRRVEITAQPNGGVLRLYNHQQSAVVELGEGPNGVGLALHDEEGVTRVAVGVRRGSPVIVLSQADSSAILSGTSLRLGMNSGRSLEIGQVDAAKNSLGITIAEGDRLPVVLSYGSAGAMLGLSALGKRTVVGASTEDSGIYIFDSARVRSSLALTKTGPGIALYDEQGASLYVRP
jgi:hypothetical protein